MPEPESDWTVARTLDRPVFFENSTGTIRTCPENYSVAVQEDAGKRWRLELDPSLEARLTADQVRRLAEVVHVKWGGFAPSPVTMVSDVADVIAPAAAPGGPGGLL